MGSSPNTQRNTQILHPNTDPDTQTPDPDTQTPSPNTQQNIQTLHPNTRPRHPDTRPRHPTKHPDVFGCSVGRLGRVSWCLGGRLCLVVGCCDGCQGRVSGCFVGCLGLVGRSVHTCSAGLRSGCFFSLCCVFGCREVRRCLAHGVAVLPFTCRHFGRRCAFTRCLGHGGGRSGR